jgi:hypothetical protein
MIYSTHASSMILLLNSTAMYSIVQCTIECTCSTFLSELNAWDSGDFFTTCLLLYKNRLILYIAVAPPPLLLVWLQFIWEAANSVVAPSWEVPHDLDVSWYTVHGTLTILHIIFLGLMKEIIWIWTVKLTKDSATLQSTQWIINAAYNQRIIQSKPLYTTWMNP